jgi:putative ABC transport system ATP-binding protein
MLCRLRAAGAGGNLILAGELSIGQLVAAELILSGVFYGIYQLGSYLDVFYDLVASAEELSQVFAIPQERSGGSGQAPADGAVRFREVEIGENRIGLARLDFEIASGEQIVFAAAPGIENEVALLLKRHHTPHAGIVSIGGSELGSLDSYLLRSAVTVLSRPTIVDITIREFLALACGGTPDSVRIMQALDLVGLGSRIASLPTGLDTRLAASGSPLSIVEVMQLKLANAVLARPHVLLLSPLYDMMPIAALRATLDEFRAMGTTVLLSTGRPEALDTDGHADGGRAPTPGTGWADTPSTASPAGPISPASSPNGSAAHDRPEQHGLRNAARSRADGALPLLARLRPPRIIRTVAWLIVLESRWPSRSCSCPGSRPPKGEGK